MPSQQRPEVIELSGSNLSSYRAGHGYGVADGLSDAAENMLALNRHTSQQLMILSESLAKALPPGHKLMPTVQALPRYATPLENMAKIFQAKAQEHRDGATQEVAVLQQAGVGIPWWKHPMFLGFAGFMCAVVTGTLVSTAMVFYLLR